MSEINWGPSVGVVALVAGIARVDVRRVLASGRRSVVTGGTAAHYQRMVDAGHRRPATGAMTVFANICCLYVPGRFSCCSGTVMAADTVTADLTMIKTRTLPATGCVAVLTVVSAANVAG